MTRLSIAGPACTLTLASLLAPSCASIQDKDAAWPEDSTGKYQLGVSTGWAFVKADVKLENGTGPLANPLWVATPKAHRPPTWSRSSASVCA
ncbi:MAG: hypothetical protein R3E96_01730 [Planctomycetota bacterium]